MTPCRFGEPGSARFAAYHAPEGAARAAAVLLCNPFGQEAVRAHRLYRVLAERLARAGFGALRFDYLGTGDSDGEDGDGDLESWSRDVLAADAELRRRSGSAVRSWFGLRLGATISLLAARLATDAPERLVLWSPVLDGPAYLRELARADAAERKCLHGDRRPDRRPPDDPAFVLGYPLADRLRAQLRALDGGGIVAPAVKAVHCIGETDDGTVDELSRSFGKIGAVTAATRLESRTQWASDEAMSTSIVPADGLKAALAALGAAS